MPFLAWICALMRAAAAAAAAAGSTFDLSAEAGLLAVALSGLRLRLTSDSLVDGERERRSNLEARLGSGSVLSKRERLRGSSAMVPASARGKGVCGYGARCGEGVESWGSAAAGGV